MNTLALQAGMIERGAVRYTPAGIPVLEFSLVHQGQVHEAGALRQIDLEVRAVAIGDIALTINRLDLSIPMVWQGFLAHTSRRSKQLAFHVTAFCAPEAETGQTSDNRI